MPLRQLRGARWIGPGLLALGVSALAFALLNPRPDRSGFEFGLLYTVTRYDQALPLLGVGIALARMPSWLCAVCLAVFVFAIFAGAFVSDWMLAAASAHPGLIGYVFLIGPICCLFVGIALAVPDRLTLVFTLPAVTFAGIALGLVISFNDPNAAEWSFAAGAVLAGLWLVVPPMLVLRGFARRWLPIPSRIFGSWLVAIGAMLMAAQLVPRPPPEPAAIDLPSGAPDASPPGLAEDVE